MADPARAPLDRKLGLRPGTTIAFAGLPPALADELGPAIARARRIARPRPGVDLVVVFAPSRRSLVRGISRWAPTLAAAGALWLAWPKRSSGVPTDLTEAEVRARGLAAGLVDVKVCALDATWAGLKFVRRRVDRRALGGPGPAASPAPRRRAARG